MIIDFNDETTTVVKNRHMTNIYEKIHNKQKFDNVEHVDAQHKFIVRRESKSRVFVFDVFFVDKKTNVQHMHAFIEKSIFEFDIDIIVDV